ncbi:uncharacterized protein LOC8270011 [Ricinus communis]|uniref:uncharacterized protein LOC8270011 n=1 Tax=Ricinus communis TaxID=3988 RepID=UPI00201B293B|nr:uncharacterized protein LOC8270011 [Ricinus communis]
MDLTLLFSIHNKLIPAPRELHKVSNFVYPNRVCLPSIQYLFPIEIVLMATFKTLALLTLALVFSKQGTLGEITCENLDQETCSYAVSSSGKRCVLETHVKRSGKASYACRNSEIEADRLRNWIETDQCIKACGLDRKSLGISSDSLLESSFTKQLCSPQCYDSCPNIIDLYFNLAAGEGVFLPKLCQATKGNARRELTADIRSSGMVALAPIQTVKYTAVPAMAPALTPTIY